MYKKECAIGVGAIQTNGVNGKLITKMPPRVYKASSYGDRILNYWPMGFLRLLGLTFLLEEVQACPLFNLLLLGECFKGRYLHNE